MDDNARREQLRNQLKAIDGSIANVERLMEPFQKLSIELQGVKEAMLELHEAAVAGQCEGCSCVLLVGDKGHQCFDGPTLCEACSPTFADVKRECDEDASGYMDEENKAGCLKAYENHIAAGGSPDDKMLHTF